MDQTTIGPIEYASPAPPAYDTIYSEYNPCCYCNTSTIIHEDLVRLCTVMEKIAEILSEKSKEKTDGLICPQEKDCVEGLILPKKD